MYHYDLYPELGSQTKAQWIYLYNYFPLTVGNTWVYQNNVTLQYRFLPILNYMYPKKGFVYWITSEGLQYDDWRSGFQKYWSVGEMENYTWPNNWTYHETPECTPENFTNLRWFPWFVYDDGVYNPDIWYGEHLCQALNQNDCAQVIGNGDRYTEYRVLGTGTDPTWSVNFVNILFREVHPDNSMNYYRVKLGEGIGPLERAWDCNSDGSGPTAYLIDHTLY